MLPTRADKAANADFRFLASNGRKFLATRVGPTVLMRKALLQRLCAECAPRLLGL